MRNEHPTDPYRRTAPAPGRPRADPNINVQALTVEATLTAGGSTSTTPQCSIQQQAADYLDQIWHLVDELIAAHRELAAGVPLNIGVLRLRLDAGGPAGGLGTGPDSVKNRAGRWTKSPRCAAHMPVHPAVAPAASAAKICSFLYPGEIPSVPQQGDVGADRRCQARKPDLRPRQQCRAEHVRVTSPQA